MASVNERPLQAEIFKASEGDAWFKRNRGFLDNFDAATDPVMRIVELFGLKPMRIAEIGASTGFRLAAFRDKGAHTTVAVEPSLAAIEEGQSRYPDIQFVRAVANALPQIGRFDLVIVNYVLHWVDRAALLATVANLDACVADGGYLVIGDFAPPWPIRVPYHHLPDDEIYTFKQNYAEAFTGSGLYRLVGMFETDHATRAISSLAEAAHRGAVWLLKRQPSGSYDIGEVSK